MATEFSISHLKQLIIDAVTLLIKNTIGPQENLEIDGTIGINLDKRVEFHVAICEQLDGSDNLGFRFGENASHSFAPDHLSKLCIEAVSLLLKSGKYYDFDCSIHGTICVTIGVNGLLLLKIKEDLVNETNNIRVVDVSRKDLYDEDEMYEDEEETMSPSEETIYTPTDLANPNKRIKYEETETKYVPSSSDLLNPRGDADDDLIVAEEDGVGDTVVY